MKFEKEITVEVTTDLKSLIGLLESKGFVLKETYGLNDVYLINKSDKSDDFYDMLSKSI